MWPSDAGTADAETQPEPSHASGSNTEAHGRGRTRPGEQGGKEGGWLTHLPASFCSWGVATVTGPLHLCQ
jgi:hypothetical protein